MSYKALAWAAEQRTGSTTGMAVLIAIASFSDERGRCWPSQSTIAEKTYLSRETVNRTIKVLEALHLVKRDGKCFVLNLEGVILDHSSVTLNHILENDGCDPRSQMCDPTSQECDFKSQPSEPVKEPVIEPVKKEKIKKEIFALPDWVPAEPWRSYVEMRQRIRRPLTDNAKRLAISKLCEFRLGGHDPTAILEQSVFNSWQGLFPPKPTTQTGGYHANTRPSIQQRKDAAFDAVDAEYAANARAYQAPPAYPAIPGPVVRHVQHLRPDPGANGQSVQGVSHSLVGVL